MVIENMSASWGVGLGAQGDQTSPPHAARLGFEEIYAQHAGFVFRVLRGMGVSEASADDAVQDVFLVVHRRLAEFDGRARVTTWLFQIALHVGLSYRRKERRARDQTPIRDTLEDESGSPLAHAERVQVLGRLQQVLDGLDDEKRAALVLSEIEQLTAPEIAELTGIPLNTVYTRLRRARALFASLWQAQEGENGL